MKNLLPTLLFPILAFAGANTVIYASDSSAESKLECEFKNNGAGAQPIVFKEKLEKRLGPKKTEYELDKCIIKMDQITRKTANIMVHINYKTKAHGLGRFRWDGQAVAKYPATFSQGEWIVLDTLAVVSSEQKPTLGGWEPDHETPVKHWFKE